MPPLKLKRHIFWENEKMRVNIAAQTFSSDVSMPGGPTLKDELE
jgi:hypothetical protein